MGGPESPDPGREGLVGGLRVPTPGERDSGGTRERPPGERDQGSQEAAQDSRCSHEHLGFCRVGRGRDAGSV